MRYCQRDGTVDLKVKGAPGEQPEDLYPWFDVPGRAEPDVRIVCGHWSTLGSSAARDLLALDTGCVWGGSLTAVNLDADDEPVQLACRSASGAGRRRRLSRRGFGRRDDVAGARRGALPVAGTFGTSVGDTKPGSGCRRALSANTGIGPQEM